VYHNTFDHSDSIYQYRTVVAIAIEHARLKSEPMSTLTPLHGMVTNVPAQPSLSIVLTLAGLTSVGILALAVVALTRRRSWSYLLVTLAIGTLGMRVLLGGLMLLGVIDLRIHHLLEHVVDVLMALLLLAAVYTARTADIHTGREQYE
jgi:hypothetical protein